MLDVGNAYYQEIGRILVSGIGEAFTQATLHAELDEDAASFKTVYFSRDGRRKQAFLEVELWPLLRELRAEMAKTAGYPWYVIDFRLNAEGEFTVDFGYDKTKWML